MVLYGFLSLVIVALAMAFMSFTFIDPDGVGLVLKRFGKKLPNENPIAFYGEAGYQADLLMPGWRFKLWPLYSIDVHFWVKVPSDGLGVVIAQVGTPLPEGIKTAAYKPEFKDFTDVGAFVANGGQRGRQRHILPPGAVAPLHPVAFIVITPDDVFGMPLDFSTDADLDYADFGLTEQQLRLTVIAPTTEEGEGVVDHIGIVTALDGDPLPPLTIAGRLREFEDVRIAEAQDGVLDSTLIDVTLISQNRAHNNYQDYQAFLGAGGKMGMQYDPLLHGSYALNPFCVDVQTGRLLTVEQGEVAVIKAYVGLSSLDVSGSAFKHGSIVRPGHVGVWREPLRTGKYAINPRCFGVEIVPTQILTINLGKSVSQAHDLDEALGQIEAKSKEGFIFKLDVQVQIHVADTKAPVVISMVGSMQNLVSEVLHAAVGNHFRDKLQSMSAVEFIQQRQRVQEEALAHIIEKLAEYEVETKGVYIQDVILPEELTAVLKQREIAVQQKATYEQQEAAQRQRIAMEKATGMADMQSQLATSEVQITINENKATARKAEAEGESVYLTKTGEAQGAPIRAIGMARAEAYKGQVEALGRDQAAFVNMINALSEKNMKIVPDVLVIDGAGGSLGGLAATLMQYFQKPEVS